MNSPVETLIPVVESSGFTLVEEDDVAFSLSLCREINRIYGSYQSGDLEGNESVHLGLALTGQILSTLARSVSKGMPAMRIEVAWAQTAEMMAVMFGESIARTKGRFARQQLEKGSASVGAVQFAPAAAAIAQSGTAPGPACVDLSGSPQEESTPISAPGSNSSQPIAEAPGTQHGDRRSFKRCLQWAGGRPVWAQLLLGVFGCIATAALIDLPVVLLLLFSNVALQLSTIYAVGAAAGWWVHRKRLHRLSDRDPVPSSNPLSWGSWNGRASPTCTAR